MMRSLNLAIPEDAAQQLERLAERDFRRPRDEAALLLVQAVRRAAQDLPVRPKEGAEAENATSGRISLDMADA